MSDEQPESPLEANGFFDTAANGTSDEIGMEERRSTRDRQASVMQDREGVLNEKKLALQKSRAAHIGNLTKVYDEIVHLTKSDASREDVSKEYARFDESWRKFVDAHESYLKLLDPFMDTLVLEQTQKTYDEQLQRKLNLDFTVRLWYKDREPERGDNYRMRQQFEQEMQEIRRKKELIEAEMETERAAVSLQIYEEESMEQSREKSFLGYLEPSQRSKIPDSSKVSVNDHLDNTTIVTSTLSNQRAALPRRTEQVDLICPGSVEPTDSIPALTTLAGNVSTAPAPIIRNPHCTPPNLVTSRSSLPKIEPRQTSVGQRVSETWSSSWQMPRPYVPPVVKVEPANEQFDSGQEMVKALRQVVSSPKVEYHRFDGDPLKYVTFMHNFETYLERDNPDESRRLQLLIQHCTGKAKEAIESCSNLRNDGYRVAKQTLRENFGKPHVIAEAHVKKLLNLPCMKSVDGPSLLELSRHLDTADRTLSGMGAEYVSDLNHMNTYRELAKKLPMFLRGRWTECAGRIIAADRRPKFQDFVAFVKERAKLVDNEFGRDMVTGTLKETPPKKKQNESKWKLPKPVSICHWNWTNSRWSKREC
ncbi:hypothetical protein ACROYT_G026225 [Oculina patagonica]